MPTNSGYAGGTFNADNAQYDFQTAPQIYTPTAPVGQRWSQLLTDSGIDRGYHNSALLIASGEVRTWFFACPSKPWSWCTRFPGQSKLCDQCQCICERKLSLHSSS